MNLPLFVAKKIYHEQGDSRKVSRPAIHIATAGVTIGLAVMIITVSVVLGFKHTIRDKVMGFGGHIQVHNALAYNDVDPYVINCDDSLMNAISSIKGVSHIERYSITQGILKTDDDFLGMALKGVGQEFDSTFISQHLIAGHIPHFTDSTSNYQLLISKMTADKLKLKIDDKIYAYFIADENVKTRKYTISGIYQTNMTRFDESICFSDLYSVNRLNGWASNNCTGVEVTVQNLDFLSEVEEAFISKINRSSDSNGNILATQTIYELYPQVFVWLDLLDINVWIILALMISVAGFTMISGLLIIILERTQMIGILKALGARNSTIRHTFLWFSVFILGRGLMWGNIIGVGIVIFQMYTGIVTLDPQTYYVNEAPMELNVPLVVCLNVVTLLICVFVLIAPSYMISHIHPAKSMRYE
ncbi:MAG: ABC transporter permease [Prevotella sp.]|nr:ABC transporter permease [Prevotella sp.]